MASATADDEPDAYATDAESELRFMRFDRARLEAMSVGIGAALARPVPADNPALRTLLQYATSIRGDARSASAELRRTITTHLYDLVAPALGRPGQRAAAAGRNGSVRRTPARDQDRPACADHRPGACGR